jgi:hypothetical protein
MDKGGHEKNILCLEIAHEGTIWNRSILVHTIPSHEELQFYYEILCGLTGVQITYTTESVPDEFNEGLLPTNDAIPTHFPAHDLETEPKQVEKRKQYSTFIRQLCDMERSRESLRLFTQMA